MTVQLDIAKCSLCGVPLEESTKFKRCDGCRKKQADTQRKWRQENREHVREMDREWHRKWREKNPDAIQLPQKRWYDTNRKEILARRQEKYDPTYYQAWHQQNRERRNERKKELNRERRMAVLKYYSESDTPFCACCNEQTIEFLCIDHKNGDGSTHRRTIGGGGDKTYRWLIKNEFPEGFRVLCSNCNASRGAYGYCPHEIRNQGG